MTPQQEFILNKTQFCPLLQTVFTNMSKGIKIWLLLSCSSDGRTWINHDNISFSNFLNMEITGTSFEYRFRKICFTFLHWNLISENKRMKLKVMDQTQVCVCACRWEAADGSRHTQSGLNFDVTVQWCFIFPTHIFHLPTFSFQSKLSLNFYITGLDRIMKWPLINYHPLPQTTVNISDLTKCQVSWQIITDYFTDNIPRVAWNKIHSLDGYSLDK